MSTEHAECPKLMWLPDGREVTAHDATEEAAYRDLGARYTVEPVEGDAVTPLVPAPSSEQEPATFGPADAAVYGEEPAE